MASGTRECHWVEAKDPASGRTYYANVITKESSWVLPPELKAFRENGNDTDIKVVEPETPATVLGQGSELLFSQQSQRVLDHEWVECFDPKFKRPYYHNKNTKQTVWERPAHLEDVPAATPATNKNVLGPEDPEPETPKEKVRPMSARVMENALGLPEVPTVVTRPSSASAGSRESTKVEPVAELAEPEPAPATAPSVAVPAPSPNPSDGTTPEISSQGTPKKENIPTPRRSDSSLKRLLNVKPKPKRVSVNPMNADEVVASPTDVSKGKVKSPMQANVALLQDIKKFQIADFAKDHFALRRKAGNMKKGNLLKFMAKKAELATMLTWSNEPMQRSLLKIKGDDYANEKAIKIYGHVLAYMGDGPSPKDGWSTTQNAQYILRRALEMEVLRDEVYCQLCKQITENPSNTSMLRGFHLMALCVGTFPPSDQFIDHLREFLKAETQESAPASTDSSMNPLHEKKMSEEKVAYANFCAERLEKIVNFGARTVVPGCAETEAVAKRQDLPVTLEFLDGTSKTVPVSSFSSVSDVIGQVARKMHVAENMVSTFGIWEESNKGTELYVKETRKMLDVLGQHELDREEDSKLSYRLLFKKRLYLKNEETSIRDPAMLHFCYSQAVHSVINNWYRVGMEEALKLAALQAHAELGDMQPGQESSGYFAKNLDKYIPAVLQSKKKPNEWDQQIVMLYKKLVGYKNSDTKAHYVNFVRKTQLYGSTFFFVENKNSIKDAPKDCILAINSRGAFLLRTDTREVVAKYEFAELCSWTFDNEGFQFVRGNIYKQETFSFRTSEGENICGVFQIYVNDLISSEFGMPTY